MSNAKDFIAAHAILPNDEKYETQLGDLLAQHGHTTTADHPDGYNIHTFADGSKAVTRSCLDENDVDSFEALLLSELLEENDEDEEEEA